MSDAMGSGSLTALPVIETQVPYTPSKLIIGPVVVLSGRSRPFWLEPEPWNRGGSSSDLFWKKRNIQFLISVYKLIFPFKSEVPLLEELSKAHVPKISAITVIAAIC